MVASALGAAAILLAVALFFILGNDDNDTGQTAKLTPSPTSSISASATPTPTSTPPFDRTVFRLAIWSREESRWLLEDLSSQTPVYREGESILFLIRIDNANPGAIYRIGLTYRCQTEGVAAFDFLTRVSNTDAEAALSDPGPGRLPSDSTIPIPDDPSLEFDKDAERRFQLWGATFHQSPQGPLPPAPCQDEKLIILNLSAHNESVFLMWGAHIASSRDWGEGRGASEQKTRFGLEGTVDELPAQEINVLPGAITP